MSEVKDYIYVNGGRDGFALGFQSNEVWHYLTLSRWEVEGIHRALDELVSGRTKKAKAHTSVGNFVFSQFRDVDGEVLYRISTPILDGSEQVGLSINKNSPIWKEIVSAFDTSKFVRADDAGRYRN